MFRGCSSDLISATGINSSPTCGAVAQCSGATRETSSRPVGPGAALRHRAIALEVRAGNPSRSAPTRESSTIGALAICPDGRDADSVRGLVLGQLERGVRPDEHRGAAHGVRHRTVGTEVRRCCVNRVPHAARGVGDGSGGKVRCQLFGSHHVSHGGSLTLRARSADTSLRRRARWLRKHARSTSARRN